ncbi:hypothetical protein BST36_22995 [Mycolicibacterium moriokaense]|uniref:Uncharacterized protein n=1 Tax=Mycolicibacterium moriokaense TaxID=39691 RepID=A0AAD1HHF5_9MYCO|nr:hypothetical protein [Mycolicibacterium moriokaense]MCV7042207.1 hypothetical protein [Mycolicibacterium moriokaense]ORB19021.1 hypothetical protein BST36_22995 [Mycolicibacterium moriokaense]BBX04979.1 hypothetical protein MMOR_59150 [Mycolicibacterium moriokaense]
MRFVATLFLWLVTTVLLAVAVPTMWAQRNVVSEDGYAALAAAAAHDPKLQRAMATELTTQIIAFAAKNGYGTLNRDLVSGVVTSYTQNDGFPGQFAQANRIAHRWMFTNSVQPEDGSGDRWLVDIAPMLNDPSIKQTLGDLDLDVPQTLTVPLTVPESSALRPGQLRAVSTWGPWISVGSTILAGVSALLTLASARSRGRALAALGVSALLVGAGGWAALEVSRRYVDAALNQTVGDIRSVAEVMVAQAEASMHQWLNLTLAAGGVLVVFGVAVSLLGGLRRRE